MAHGRGLAVDHSSFCDLISAAFLMVVYQSRRGPCCFRLNVRAAVFYAVQIRAAAAAAAAVHDYSRR